MTKYEELLEETYNEGIDVLEYPFQGNLRGICFNEVIGVRDNLSEIEKGCVLAEEIGHFRTTVGNILDQSDINNRKQELKAQAWSYDRLIGVPGLIRAYEHGCINQNEIAEYLNVSEEFLQKAVNYYKGKYDSEIRIENYEIHFQPSLIITKI